MNEWREDSDSSLVRRNGWKIDTTLKMKEERNWNCSNSGQKLIKDDLNHDHTYQYHVHIMELLVANQLLTWKWPWAWERERVSVSTLSFFLSNMAFKLETSIPISFFHSTLENNFSLSLSLLSFILYLSRPIAENNFHSFPRLSFLTCRVRRCIL